VGRNDDQVKIRGYRIERGEIETAIQGLDGIRQACVIAKERNNGSASNKFLVAYYVANRNGIKQPDLAQELSKRLPDDMVLAEFDMWQSCRSFWKNSLPFNGQFTIIL